MYTTSHFSLTGDAESANQPRFPQPTPPQQVTQGCARVTLSQQFARIAVETSFRAAGSEDAVMADAQPAPVPVAPPAGAPAPMVDPEPPPPGPADPAPPLAPAPALTMQQQLDAMEARFAAYRAEQEAAHAAVAAAAAEAAAAAAAAAAAPPVAPPVVAGLTLAQTVRTLLVVGATWPDGADRRRSSRRRCPRVSRTGCGRVSPQTRG